MKVSEYIIKIQRRLEKNFPFPGWGRISSADITKFDESIYLPTDYYSSTRDFEVEGFNATLYSQLISMDPNLPYDRWVCHVFFFKSRYVDDEDVIWAYQKALRIWGRQQIKGIEDHSIIGVLLSENGFSKSVIDIIERAYYVEEVGEGVMGQYLVGVDLSKELVYVPLSEKIRKLGKHAESGLKKFFDIFSSNP